MSLNIIKALQQLDSAADYMQAAKREIEQLTIKIVELEAELAKTKEPSS